MICLGIVFPCAYSDLILLSFDIYGMFFSNSWRFFIQCLFEYFFFPFLSFLSQNCPDFVHFILFFPLCYILGIFYCSGFKWTDLSHCAQLLRLSKELLISDNIFYISFIPYWFLSRVSILEKFPISSHMIHLFLRYFSIFIVIIL